MFERYTEKARRVIFFARYEASQYGSPYIETEHLLLGLVREDPTLARPSLGNVNAETAIRAEIEKHITTRERISTSVEVPLSGECKKILHIAAEEADRLAHRHIGTGHLLLGILRMEGSLAAQVLLDRGVRLATLREELAKHPDTAVTKVDPSRRARLRLEDFLSGLKKHNSEELLPFFAENAHFVDASGKPWNREEIGKHFETLFLPYAKKNAAYTIEETIRDTSEVAVSIVLWKNAILTSLERAWMHRMCVVLAPEGDDWAIVLVQVTPLKTTAG
jgi:hypothetical protein